MRMPLPMMSDAILGVVGMWTVVVCWCAVGSVDVWLVLICADL